tara:strand:+ start:408 stop:533 length:126 start_codon:yes stop_codon:yes gene_type:complete
MILLPAGVIAESAISVIGDWMDGKGECATYEIKIRQPTIEH